MRCDYKQDKGHWLNYAHRTNSVYAGLVNLLDSITITPPPSSSSEKENVTTIPWSTIPILVIDMMDLDSFYDQLSKYLPPSKDKDMSEETHHNPESLLNCDFFMPSEMMKATSPAYFSVRKILDYKATGVVHYRSDGAPNLTQVELM